MFSFYIAVINFTAKYKLTELRVTYPMCLCILHARLIRLFNEYVLHFLRKTYDTFVKDVYDFLHMLDE